MEIFKKLNMHRQKYSEMTDFCIRTVRFKKLLENVHSLMALYEDGSEKLKGEYILDRHYVVALTERMIEGLGMIAYDVSTLSPENGRKLFSAYDLQKHTSEKILSGEITFSPRETMNSEETYPEFTLLSSVLSWFDGEEEGSIIKIIKQAVTDGVFGIFKPDDIHKWVGENTHYGIGGHQFHIYDLWKDAFISGGSSRSPSDMDCIPLKCLFMESEEKKGGAFSKNTGEWLALTSEYEMGLMSVDSYKHLRIDASISGNGDSDYLFVFAHNRLDLGDILPPGFHVEKSTSGYLCWKRGGPAGDLEENLMKIGQNLFG